MLSASVLPCVRIDGLSLCPSFRVQAWQVGPDRSDHLGMAGRIGLPSVASYAVSSCLYLCHGVSDLSAEWCGNALHC